MQIQPMTRTSDFKKCFDAFKELRPHLKNKEEFVAQVENQTKEGYKIHAIYEGEEVASCIGWRVFTVLAWGKVFYIDDLITKEKHRSKGHGGALLKYAINLAKELSCDQIHLDTGFTRHAAHRSYLNHGFELTSHHMSIKLQG